LMIYPNPLNGSQSLNIQGLSRDFGATKISISNNLGVLVFEEIVQVESSILELQIPDISNGIYLLSIQNSNWSSTIKLVK